MFPKDHIILGFAFSFLLFLIFPEIDFFAFLIIFLSSFLIDADAYIYWIFSRKSFNLKKAYKYLKTKRKDFFYLSKKERISKAPSSVRIFHGIEILLILFLFGFFLHDFFLYIFIGCLFHLFLDIAERVYFGLKPQKISLIYDFIKFKKYN